MATIPASENEFPEVLLAEGAAPAAPGANLVKIYAKSDGLPYTKDDANTESPMTPNAHIADTTDAHDASAVSFDPTGATNITATEVQGALDELDAAVSGGGIPATIVDAAGDLIVGTAADTVARLAIGAAGGHLSRINGALAWDSGTSNPGSAAAGDRFWRTDLGLEIYYDGTRWLSTQVFTHQMVPRIGMTSTTGVGDMGPSSIAVTTSGILRVHVPSVLGASNLWFVNYKVGFNIGGGGSALSASHKWVGVVQGLDSASAGTGTIATVNIDSGSSGVWRETTVTIGAAMAAGTMIILIGWTKTGTPGVLTTGETLTYRLIVT